MICMIDPTQCLLIHNISNKHKPTWNLNTVDETYAKKKKNIWRSRPQNTALINIPPLFGQTTAASISLMLNIKSIGTPT